MTVIAANVVVACAAGQRIIAGAAEEQVVLITARQSVPADYFVRLILACLLL